MYFFFQGLRLMSPHKLYHEKNLTHKHNVGIIIINKIFRNFKGHNIIYLKKKSSENYSSESYFIIETFCLV